MMNFPKTGQVRIEQLRDEIRRQVVEFPAMAIQWKQAQACIEIEDVDGKATRYQAELQAVIDAHVATMTYFDSEKESVIEEHARAGWRSLPEWIFTATPNEAELYVRNNILDGINDDGAEGWVDNAITGTNVAQLREQTKAALKVIAKNLITIRTILGIIAKVILYIRDILIKRP